MADLPELVVADASAWGAWLDAHDGEPDGVWLVLAKKGVADPTSLTYDQALDEALCHGWIDGQVTKRDGATYRQRFTPRRSRSPWSQRNVGLVARLASEGRMRARGVAEVERAQADGRWEAAYAGQASAEVPADLQAAIDADPAARAMFAVLTRQNRYALIYRLRTATEPGARATRIAAMAAMLARGETPWPQKARPPA